MHASRREFLAGAAALGSALRPGAAPDDGGADRIEALAARLLAAPHEPAVALAREELRAGRSFRELLGATFLAGIREVRPRPVGFKLHAVMMVPSALAIAERLPGPERLLPVLFNVDDLKRAQASDDREGGWRLPDATAAEPGDAGAARAAFVAAMNDWDDPAAQLAATRLHATTGIDEAFELLCGFAVRDFGNIGHKIIFVVQAWRTLHAIGWRHGEPVLRSLVHGLLHGGAADAELHETNHRRAAALPDGELRGRTDLAAARRLHLRMRDADAGQAAEATVALLRGGATVETIWDGLRLAAFEQLAERPGILAVHPVTTLNAFHDAFQRVRSAELRRLLLLQAASWTALFAEFLAQRGEANGFRIDAVEPRPAGTATPADLLAATAKDPAQASALAADLCAAGRGGALADELRRALARRAREHHDYKFLVAALEEIAAADRKLRPALTAAMVRYVRGDGDPENRFVAMV